MFVERDSIDQEYSSPEYMQAKLEMMFIEEHLASKGFHLKGLHLLPKAVARELMRQACIYASNKLAEIEIRSNLFNALRG